MIRDQFWRELFMLVSIYCCRTDILVYFYNYTFEVHVNYI